MKRSRFVHPKAHFKSQETAQFETQAEPPSTTKGGRRTASSAVEVVEAGPSGSQHEEDEPSSGASADEKPGRGKAKAKAKADVNDVSDIEVEEAPPQAAKRSKGKQKVAEQDSEVEVVDAPQAKPAKGKSKAAASKPATQTRTRKRKVSPESSIENDVEEVEPKDTKQKRGGRAGSVAPSTAAKLGKHKKRTPSPVPDDPPLKRLSRRRKGRSTYFPLRKEARSISWEMVWVVVWEYLLNYRLSKTRRRFPVGQSVVLVEFPSIPTGCIDHQETVIAIPGYLSASHYCDLAPLF
ncbi:hypothetical protein IMY05_C4695000500 [Salix suchowensis]|nr:hypothetical protein IMY05_C4695000500 [Salix suchowensis]